MNECTIYLGGMMTGGMNAKMNKLSGMIPFFFSRTYAARTLCIIIEKRVYLHVYSYVCNTEYKCVAALDLSATFDQAGSLSHTDFKRIKRLDSLSSSHDGV